MKEYNGLELLNIMNQANEQGVSFEIKETSVLGMKGIYIEFEDYINDLSGDDDYFNIALIKKIRN